MELGVPQVKSIVENGGAILWAGSSASGEFFVKCTTSCGERERIICDPEAWATQHRTSEHVDFVETRGVGGAHRGLVPPGANYFRLDRVASVMGINIGGDCVSGACKRYEKTDSCTMSYDIETSTKDVRVGGFGLVDCPILSIAAKCSCGHTFYQSSAEGNTSASLVTKFFDLLSTHAPLWLIGWNCYDFDNECMRYHCSEMLKKAFRVSRIGAFGKPTYGSILSVIGTYNVDVMVYLKRAMYSLSSFKLADVAVDMDVTRKTEMPNMKETPDRERLMEYNINDCVVVLDIWKKERLDEVIPSIALCSSSPVYDCCRYVTGTMATNAYASHMHSLGYCIEWNPVKTPEDYSGGYVMEPIKGLHCDVSVCDFKSMYPTIMSSCNINPHDFTLEMVQHTEPVGKVELYSNTTVVWLKNKVATFDRSNKSELSRFMEYLIAERDNVRKAYPMYAKSLKIVANSVYGNIGYDASWMYSAVCAASVTAIGRHCVKMARTFFEEESGKVVYMDTDSCMVETSERNSVEVSLRKLHSHMSNLSVREMKMVIEERFPKAIMINKKKYCMLRSDGTMKTVGISIARRDVSGLCKEAARRCLDSLLKSGRQDAVNSIAAFIEAVKQMSIAQAFTLSDVSRYVKKDGSRGYSYPSRNGTVEFVPEKEAVLSSLVQCDASKVLESVAKEIERFTIPCHLGKVSDVLMECTVL